MSIYRTLIAKLEEKLGILNQINTPIPLITVLPPTAENSFRKQYFIYQENVTALDYYSKPLFSLPWVPVKKEQKRYVFVIEGFRDSVRLHVNVEVYILENNQYNDGYVNSCILLIDEIEAEITTVVNEYLDYYTRSEMEDGSMLRYSTIDWYRFPDVAKHIITLIFNKRDSGLTTKKEANCRNNESCSIMGGSHKKRGKKTRQNKKRRGHKSHRHKIYRHKSQRQTYTIE